MAIYKLEENTPEIAETAWVAESAVVVGKVKLEEHASVWFNVSIRGDNELITIGEGALIGIQAIVLNGAKIGKNSLVGAGALVTEGKEFPENSLIIGSPAKAVRTLSEEDIARMRAGTDSYVERAQLFKTSLKRIA